MISDSFRMRQCRHCIHAITVEYQARTIEVCAHRRDTAVVKSARERRATHPQMLDRIEHCPDPSRSEQAKEAA